MAIAGDFDYERGGQALRHPRRTDPRIAALVHAALGSARTVLNVGAGAGSYEPDRPLRGGARALGRHAGPAPGRTRCPR